MFGNVNSEVIKHLEFALQGVQGERGHKLEASYLNPLLTSAEDNIALAIAQLEEYQRKAKLNG